MSGPFWISSYEKKKYKNDVMQRDTDRYEKNYPLILKSGVDRQIAKYLMWFAWFFVAFHSFRFFFLVLFGACCFHLKQIKCDGWKNARVSKYENSLIKEIYKTPASIAQHTNEIKLIKSKYNIIYHAVDRICKAFFCTLFLSFVDCSAFFWKGFARHVERTYLECR